MTDIANSPLEDALRWLSAPDPICYCPCAGRDVALALTWLGSRFNRFVFCDKGYRRSDMTAIGGIPEGWQFVQAVPAHRPMTDGRPDRSRIREVVESWRRPDGATVALEFRADPSEDCLTDRFGAGTLSAFLHINDGTGEGGSNLWFLASPDSGRAPTNRALLPVLVERLADEAMVISDGRLTDIEFSQYEPFRHLGRRWEPITPLENTKAPARQVTVWRTFRETEQAG